MASIHFYLNKTWSYKKIKDTEEKSPKLFSAYQSTKLQIHCIVSSCGKRIKVYTGKRIEPIYWDFERERANTKIYKKHGVDLNEFLSDLETIVAKVADQNENKGRITTIEEIRELVKPREVRKAVAIEATTFETLFK